MAKIVIGSSQVIDSVSTCCGPCHVAISECGLVIWMGLAAPGIADLPITNSK